MGTRCRFSDVVTIDLALLYVQENENMLFAIDEGLRRLAERIWLKCGSKPPFYSPREVDVSSHSLLIVCSRIIKDFAEHEHCRLRLVLGLEFA